MREPEVVKVVITSATNTFCWYWGKTGQVFEVTKMSGGGYRRVDGEGRKTNHFIESCDCQEVK